MSKNITLCMIAFVASTSLGLVNGTTNYVSKPKTSFTPVVDPNNNDAAMCAVDPPTAVFPLVDVSVGIPDGVPGSIICSFSCSGFPGCLCFNYRQQQNSAPAQCEFYNYIPRNCTTDAAGFCQHYEVTGQSFSSCFPTVAGGWSEWIYTTPCSAVGQKYAVQSRYCNNPVPSNGGSACYDTSGSPATVETRQLQCDCDPHCTSGCTKGYLQCDSTCGVGYGLNQKSFVCEACNSTNCNSSCNQYGPGTCDGPCTPGYYLNTTQHTCMMYRYRYIGCYTDASVRDLAPEIWSTATMTPSFCANSCQSKGYTYAGVQDGSYCLCGNTYGRYGPATNCNMKCSGDGSQICGGGWANNVMQCGCDPNCNNIEDCFINGAGKCDSTCKSGWTMTSDHSCKRCDPQCNTTACTNFQCSSCVAGYGISKNPEVCLECNTPNCLGSCNNYGPGTCDGPCQAGYGLNAALHVCLQCNTPNCLGSCDNYGPGTCDGPCQAGYGLHATLHVCLLFPYRSLGCYTDGPIHDLSSTWWSDPKAMTLSVCMQSCHNNGYSFAGAQAGQSCFCGNSYGKYGIATACSTVCAGNSSEICGGTSINSVMDFHCDPNCADPNDCLLYGVFKCDTQCKPGYSMTSRHTCKGCPTGYTTLAGLDNCYMSYFRVVTRTEAAALCDSINSDNATYDVHLAYIETAEEQTALSNLIGDVYKLTWIGGCRTPANDNSFVWARSCTTYNGPAVGIQTENMNYAAWSPGYPDNAGGLGWCVIMENGGLWMDEDCDYIFYQFVCEIEN